MVVANLEASLAHIAALVGSVPDPEIPALNLSDLGIYRSTQWIDDTAVVSLTPTYSGCPATEAIRADVLSLLNEHGYSAARVQIVLDPAWTTDWITPEGHSKLKAYGIAPPSHCVQTQLQGDANISGHGATSNVRVLQFLPPASGIRCPLCESSKTERISQFGSTPCKALYRCLHCQEPFDYFKPI
jgi:ring-1,2-phenylacetyl-CoA epoxidase subunit PaaD